MVKSLDQINQEFLDFNDMDTQSAPPLTGGKKALKIASDIIFYLIIVLLIVAAVVYSQSSEKGKSLFGYSYYDVLTGSMQEELPQGSFILVKSVDADTLKVGDNITFFYGTNVVVTHKINAIYDNYQSSGRRGFQTKGTHNLSPDDNITYADNVIGKVVFHIPGLGYVMNFFSQHIIFCIFAFLILMGICFCIRILLTPDSKNGKSKNKSSLDKAVGNQQ